MLAVRSALLLLCLTCALTQIQGQDDFDLAGALDDDPTPPPTKKPVPPLKPDSGADADFDLGDAIGGAGPVTKKPVPQPNPGAGGDAGGDEVIQGGKQSLCPKDQNRETDEIRKTLQELKEMLKDITMNMKIMKWDIAYLKRKM